MTYSIRFFAVIIFLLFAFSLASSGESIKGIPSGTAVVPRVITSIAAIPKPDPRNKASQRTDGSYGRPEALEMSEEEMEELKAAPKPEFDGKGKLTIDPNAPSSAQQVMSTQAPVLSTNFEGNTQGASLPGDLMAASGPDHIVSVTNSSVKIRNKSGVGSPVVLQANDFFGFPFASASTWYDPKVAYDIIEKRFVVLFDYNGNNAGAKYWIAVSQTSSALGGWYIYAFDMSLDGNTPTNNWSDYPGLGFDDNSIYMTANMFSIGASPSFQYVKTRVLSKFVIYNGLPAGYIDILDVPGSGSHFTLKPAISLTSTSTEYLALTPSGGGAAVQLYKITGGPSSPVLEKIAHLTASVWGVPPDGVQQDCPATPIDGGDARIGDPVWRNGYLYATHCVGVTIGGTGVAAVKNYKINTTALSLDVDEVYGATSTFYTYPAIAVDAVGSVYLSFSRSSSTEYPTACYSGRRRFDSAMQPSGILRSGSTAYRCGSINSDGRNRWGDYDGISIDPSDSGDTKSSAWAMANWSKGTSTWGAWIGKISFNYHRIQGYVFDDCDSSAATSNDRRPLPLYGVTLQRDTTTIATTTTDSVGFYNFGFLDDGTYHVIVTVPPGTWSVDALPGTGGDAESKITSTKLEVTLSGAATAGLTSINNDFLIAVSHPVPVTTSISPDAYSVGEPDFTLTVVGSNFIPCSIVRVDGANRVTTFVNSGEVQATVLAADIASLGTRSITVFNPSPDGGESNTQTLTIHAPAPVFTVHPGSIDFGQSLIGVTMTDCVVVVNAGTADLIISGVGSDDSQFNATPAGGTIPRQDSLKFTVTFDPSAVGAAGGHIIFSHNAATSPDLVDVSGVGLDSASFRTASANDWASAIDAKGKHKAYPRKNDKVFFKLNITSPSDGSLGAFLDLYFNIPIGSLKAYTSPFKTDTLPYDHLFSDAKKKLWRYTFVPPLAPGTFIQIDGIGLQGKVVKIGKYVWLNSGTTATQKGKVPDVNSAFVSNVPALPRPNLVNVADELFPKGFGQPTPYFSDLNPLVLGVPQSAKGQNSVKLSKSANVVKSFIDEKTGTKHTQPPSCLDNVNVPKQLTVFSPLKKNDIAFAEVLALRLNIAASATSKFPPGLGELTFNDPNAPANPFNTKLVKEIARYGDSLLGCLNLQSISPSPNLAQVVNTIHQINGAFADTGNQKDTISFSPKTRLPGVLPVASVDFLHITPGIVPESFVAADVVNTDIPLVYALHQNYPNPFNPTTIIRFDLPEQSVVTLRVFNVLGQQVATPIDQQVMEDGVHEIEFDGQSLSSGVYFYQIFAAVLLDEDNEAAGRVSVSAPQFTSIKKMLLMR